MKEKEIIDAVNIQTASNSFDLGLDMGNYSCNYSRNGRSLLLASSQGHCAILDWKDKDLLL